MLGVVEVVALISRLELVGGRWITSRYFRIRLSLLLAGVTFGLRDFRGGDGVACFGVAGAGG